MLKFYEINLKSTYMRYCHMEKTFAKVKKLTKKVN